MKTQAIVTLLLVMLITLIETSANVCLKSAIEKVNATVVTFREMVNFAIRLLFIPIVWLGFSLSISMIVMWVFVLAKSDLSFVYSLSSIHYIFIALASQFFLKEKVDRKRWSATLLIAVGVFIVTLSG